MSVFTDAELQRRAADTLAASWQQYSREAIAAELVRARGTAIAVFPHEPERSFYNNALLECQLDAVERAAAIDAIESAYRQAGVTSFAAWVHEQDTAMRADLERRGYAPTESTRAMGISLDEVRLPRPSIDLARAEWSEHLLAGELPADLLAGGDHGAYHLLVARCDGMIAATGMAFDHGTDCGIYNVATMEWARRRGLGTSLTLGLLYGAIDRGCVTASLQSTRIAERVYAAVGFRDLGRILEYAPCPQG